MASVQDPVPGIPWTLETLVQAAQQVIQGQPSSQEGESSPEKTKSGAGPEMRTLVVKDIRICSVQATSAALLDSGATHCLRNATSVEEWRDAEKVMVELAGKHMLQMRMTSGGTLLMPYKQLHGDSSSRSAQTIVPLGQLVQTLGYSLIWTPTTCFLQDSEGEKIPLKVSSGCPQLQEVEALALIARIEERKRERLVNESLTLGDRLNIASMEMNKTWEDHLRQYAIKGDTGDGLRALRDAPFLEDLPSQCLTGLVPADVKESGWSILKEISFLSRHQHRRLLLGKRWVIHMYSGETDRYEFFKLDQSGTVVLELDIRQSRGQDVFRPELWRLLVWGARMGRVDVIFGGPPGRTKGSFDYGARDDASAKPLAAVTRVIWLHAVAEAGRLENGEGRDRARPVGFLVEHPEDQGYKDVSESGTVGFRTSLWATSLWRTYSEVGGLRTASFDQGAMGALTRSPTTIGTNMDHLLSLDELRVDPSSTASVNSSCCSSTCVWSPGLVRAIVVALIFWDRASYRYPMIRAMTPTQWRAHVDSNHSDYRRDCLTCVLARGTGKRHRRIHHPDSYVLTADIAGPLKPGLDPTSKGKMGKGLKHILVAKYIVPKEFIKGVSDKAPPDDDGVGVEPAPTPEEENFGAELFGRDQELHKQPSPPPPSREGPDKGHEFSSVVQGHGEVPKDELYGDNVVKICSDEELKQPSQPPPSRECRFIDEHVPAEPGPLNSEHVPAEPGPPLEPRQEWESEDEDWLKEIEKKGADVTTAAIQESGEVNGSEELDYDPSFAGDSDGEEETVEHEQHEPKLIVSRKAATVFPRK